VAKDEVYISIDIEADGPVPGPYSMLSFGMAVCGTSDGSAFTVVDPASRTFYAELKPISDEFEPDALAVSGLDRAALAADGRDPAEAMTDAVVWVGSVAAELAGGPVVVAYPLGFDWMWLYWYLMRFAGSSPFGHSRHLDMKTIYAVKARTTISRSSKRQMPSALLSKRRHTHNALDDAIEQGEMFQNLMRWDGS
jgi:hypothetical protein